MFSRSIEWRVLIVAEDATAVRWMLVRRLLSCSVCALAVFLLALSLCRHMQANVLLQGFRGVGAKSPAPEAETLGGGARGSRGPGRAASSRRSRRAADEKAAASVWSPTSPSAVGRSHARPMQTGGHRTGFSRKREAWAGQRRDSWDSQQRPHASADGSTQAEKRYAPDHVSWSPYHIVLAHPGSKAHRDGKLGVPGRGMHGQELWTPEWKQETTGGGGFTLRMYGLNSDCRRGAGANIVCPRKWIPHDYLGDWDDHGEDDRGGLHSWEGSAVVSDVSATSMTWFTNHIRGSSPAFLAVWWGQLPIVRCDDYT